MITPQAARVIKVLGGDSVTRFVGGCVRNFVLGEDTGDIDLATQLEPGEVMRRLKEDGIKAVPTGIDHGTVTAVCEGIPFEVTTLRRDVETDGRHAVVAFTDDWAEDARRRDFTMNTLSADLSGRIYDPLGRGLSDLKKGKVIFVGKAAERIAEDYLRVLRFFRFHARYGRGRPDTQALASCAAASRKLKVLSVERVTQEFLKLLAVPKSPSTLTLMRENGLLRNIIPTSYDERRLAALIRLQKRYGTDDLSARLVLVAGLKRSGVKALETSLRLPRRTLLQIEAIIDAVKTLKDISDHTVRLSLYRHGLEATRQALLVLNAPARYLKMEAVPVFPVTGKDLVEEGYKPGPGLGAELKRREAAWIRRGFA